ncbi:MAG: CHAT domain-containing protein [Pirellulales bacterium]
MMTSWLALLRPDRTVRWPAVLVALAAALFAGYPAPAVAQLDIGRRSVPSDLYYLTFNSYYQGEYRGALADFRAEGRGAIKTVDSLWIDSICYHTMTGECYYQMGQLPQALQHYTSALELYLAYSDWMIRVQFPPAIQPAGAGAYKPIPWGRSTRQVKLGRFPTTMLMSRGRIDNTNQVKQGGIVQQATYFPIHVDEIVRATTIALRRRRELLGPVSPHDPLTGRLISALARRPSPANHWSEAWIDVQLGLAYAAGGKDQQAQSMLERAVVAGGEYDHPLTSTALLELGRLAMARGDFDPAARYFEEATYSAVQFSDPGILEEAFRYGLIAHLMANKQGPYPPLLTAAAWARVKRYRQLEASLWILAAENAAVIGQPQKALELLAEAKLAIGRREMGAGKIGARLNYVTALGFYQQRNAAAGDQALDAALTFQRAASLWLFQISLADGLYVQGTQGSATGVAPRVAMDLFADVLRDPKPADWSFDPLESLSVLLISHPLPLEHWFEAALERKEHETALEIADRLRRHRFYSTLPFGGRLLSLRWLVEGPAESLDQVSKIQRQALLVRYPQLAELSQKVRQIRADLEKPPLVVDDPAARQSQTAKLAQVAKASLLEEAMLREIAVRREPATLVFPPLRTAKDIQESLPEGQVLLVFLATSRGTYGFLMNNKKYADWWQMPPPQAISRQLAATLREMGHYDQNHQLDAAQLTSDKWKTSTQAMYDLVFKGSKVNLTSGKFDELVIVPDGALWYLPFEAFQVPGDKGSQSLLAKVRIRYAPTASLAIADGRSHKRSGNTAVVVGRLYPQDEDSVAQAEFEQLSQAVPGAVALKMPLPAPAAVYASLFDRLIVLDDIKPAEKGPYSWFPVPLDRSKGGGALEDWMPLPWAGPDQVILPGFHTAAESGLKRNGPAADGSEVFLSVCGLMASGARTILISRWRTGGQTAFDLVREFTQELPHATPAEAWQRSALLAAAAPLNPESEPRVQRGGPDRQLKTDHPFFWSGYLLVDSGTAAAKTAVSPAAAKKDAPKKEEPKKDASKKDDSDAGEPKEADAKKDAAEPAAPPDDAAKPDKKDATKAAPKAETEEEPKLDIDQPAANQPPLAEPEPAPKAKAKPPRKPAKATGSSARARRSG